MGDPSEQKARERSPGVAGAVLGGPPCLPQLTVPLLGLLLLFEQGL